MHNVSALSTDNYFLMFGFAKEIMVRYLSVCGFI